MFTRCLSLFLLFSVLAQGQTHGSGQPGVPSTPANAGTNPAGSPNAHISSAYPIATADGEGKIEFRTQTILVQVPIIVTNKSGSHIHGLTKENFHLFENGKEQRLSTLEEVVTTNTKLPVVAPKPGEFSNLTLSEQQPRNVTVIVLDTVNTPALDQTYARRELVKYLANSLDSGRVLALMIITSRGLKIVQGLAGDPTQLLQALKRVSGDLPAIKDVRLDARAAAAGVVPYIATIAANTDPTTALDSFVETGDEIYAQFQQQNAIETTMNAFLGIAWSLSGIPGRKSLIWATGGFPFTITSPAAVPGGYLSTLYERTMQALNASQISVYPVDVRGLLNISPIGNARQSNLRSGPALIQQIDTRFWLQQSTFETLDEFAAMTGGRALYNTNDLASSFKRVDDDASSYYLASYYLDKTNNHAGWRPLKVKVDKQDAEIRARKGIFVTNATIHFELSRNSDISYAVTSPIEGTGVPISVRWLAVSGDGPKKKAELQIHLPPDGVSIEANKGANDLNFDIAIAAFVDDSKNNQPASTTSKTITASLGDAKMASLRANGFTMTHAMELAPGRYAVRVVIRDNVNGKMGSVTAPLTVN
jgi:VWFA-related protein